MQTIVIRSLLIIVIALGWIAPPAHAEQIVGLTTINSLLIFDSATPGTVSSPIPVTGLVGGETLLGIDRRPATGILYGLGSTGTLYTINTTTGVATVVGSSGVSLSGKVIGFDFNPTVDVIRVTTNTGQNFRLNPNTGALTATDTNLAYVAGDVNAGVAPFVVGSAYTNNVAGAATTLLFDIDSALNILATQNPPNSGTLNTIGPLGIDTAFEVGFDISGLTAIAYAALTSDEFFTALYQINLNTGHATLVGGLGSLLTLADIAAPVGSVPEPATVVLLTVGAGALLAMGRRRR